VSIISEGPFRGLIRHGYKVLLADPPWNFRVRSDKGLDRTADMHYPTMSLDDIKALPVADLAAPNCVLFMWVTDTHLEQSFEVITAWGFKYKTVGFYWAKTNKDGSDFTGMGYWTRANPEQCLFATTGTDDQCLLATRGRPIRLAKDVRRLIQAPRREHSRKPDETHERIEALVPGPYLELFARTRRPDWTTWGNEPGRFGHNGGPALDDDTLALLGPVRPRLDPDIEALI
jgi:N6-adenosine-specific RNA methylase IME4